MSRPVGMSTRFVIVSSAMLSFISFWRAAAIILSDLGSSAYYVGGLVESAVGKSAPWFVLAIMFFSYAVRAVYIESCSMFVRGGVYKVVHEAMGRTVAKFSVSALMFDYVLTGPISGVSAGLYLAGLANEMAQYAGRPGLPLASRLFAALFAVVVTLYFWGKNVMGMRESSSKALRIMQITSVMVVMLVVWCIYTAVTRGAQPVPFPTQDTMHLGKDAAGWLEGSWATRSTAICLMIGLGHALLAMSGEESLAQVNREIAAPKVQSLQRTGFIVFVYSMVLTSFVSFFAVMLIPDDVRHQYFDNLIGGLSMYLAGPQAARLAFHAFVVLVGTLILSGAVNTSLIGSNGVLNRVAEDGVLPDWLRHTNARYGTTHRIITLVAALQLVTIIISAGNVEILGEAYAFGVAWSFAMKALAVLVLRYKRREPRPWRVPLNISIGDLEIPVGLGIITAALFALAVVNLFTKEVATIAGGIFTVVFFAAFTISERYNRADRRSDDAALEEFNLIETERLSPARLEVRPGGIIFAMHDPAHADHVRPVLEHVDPEQIDMVVLLVHTPASAPVAETPAPLVDEDLRLFSAMVHVAESVGKPMKLLAVSGDDIAQSIFQSAAKLHASRVVVGLSGQVSPQAQQYHMGRAWKALSPPRPAVRVTLLLGHDEWLDFELAETWSDIAREHDEAMALNARST